MQTNEQKAEYLRQYRLRNKERLDQQNKEYRENNKEEIKRKQREYYAKKSKEEKLSYRIKNRERIREQDRKWRKENRVKRIVSDMKSKFGITFEDYKRMWFEQKGCCAICGKFQLEFNQRLAIDHNHTTGQIRQLLCKGCNTGIGNLQEDVEIMKRAIDYLNKWNSIKNN